MDTVVLTVTLFSKGGLSVYKQLENLNRNTFKDFIPDIENIQKAKKKFADLGFYIEAESEVGLSISGSVELVNQVFGVNVFKEKIKYIKDFEKYVYNSDKEIKAPFLEEYIEKIVLPKQSFELGVSEGLVETDMPFLDYYHLKLPEDIIRISKADSWHKKGYMGQGVNVIMIDTGLYKHNYYKFHGIDFEIIPAVRGFNTDWDERGHGTAMSSVLLSIAPKANYKLVKLADYFHSYPIAAFQKASMLKPDIINCSWGTIEFEPHLYLEIANAIEKGIVVVFSSGNGSSDRRSSLFQTICYPDVISVGGCFPDLNCQMEISDISSSYESDIYTNRQSPDVCGVCGKLPKAQLILFPTQPGCIFDRNNGKRDGTKTDDGWLVSSGTSAAAAYVSGIIALLKQRYPELSGINVKNILHNSANDVVNGTSFMGHKAKQTGWNKAAGYGFIELEGIETLINSNESLIIRNSRYEKKYSQKNSSQNNVNPDIIMRNKQINDQEKIGLNYKHIDHFSEYPIENNLYLYLRVQNNSIKVKNHNISIYTTPITPCINILLWKEYLKLETGELPWGEFKIIGPIDYYNQTKIKNTVGILVDENILQNNKYIYYNNNHSVYMKNGTIELSFYLNNPLNGEQRSSIKIDFENLNKDMMEIYFNNELISKKNTKSHNHNIMFWEEKNCIHGLFSSKSNQEIYEIKIIANENIFEKDAGYIHIYQKLNEDICGYLRFSLFKQSQLL